MNSSWVSLLNDGQYNVGTIGTALTNSASLTDISPGAAVVNEAFAIPAVSLSINQALRVTAEGIITTNSSPPSLTLGLYLGGVAGSVLAHTTFASPSASMSNSQWTLKSNIVWGPAGNVGFANITGTVGGIGSSGQGLIATTSGYQSAWSNTFSQLLTVGAQWGSANSSLSITVINFFIELLN